jgi:hypothetical protein
MVEITITLPTIPPKLDERTAKNPNPPTSAKVSK